MKNLTLVVGLTVLLAACTQIKAPPAVGSVAVTGDTSLVIGQSKTLTTTLKDTEGNALTGRNITWTSSAPDLISVDAAGKITARHFSPDASKKTVTITATSEGKSGTINVMPYGFDISCGTYKLSTTAETQVAFYTRFRMPDGTGIAADTDYSVTGPAFVSYEATVFAGSSSGGAYGGAVAVDGTYNASMLVGGVTYKDTCVIDAKAVLGFVTSPAVSVSGNQIAFSGTAPAGATHVYAQFTNDTAGYGTAATPISAASFALTSTLSTTPVAGTYEARIFARNYNNTSPMPESVLLSAVKVKDVTIP